MECIERSSPGCVPWSILEDWKIGRRSPKLLGWRLWLGFIGTGSSNGSMTSAVEMSVWSKEGLLLLLLLSLSVTWPSVERELLLVGSLLKSIRSGTVARPAERTYSEPEEQTFKTVDGRTIFVLGVLLLGSRARRLWLAGAGDDCCRW